LILERFAIEGAMIFLYRPPSSLKASRNTAAFVKVIVPLATLDSVDLLRSHGQFPV
jgi:hypothetical protein